MMKKTVLVLEELRVGAGLGQQKRQKSQYNKSYGSTQGEVALIHSKAGGVREAFSTVSCMPCHGEEEGVGEDFLSRVRR